MRALWYAHGSRMAASLSLPARGAVRSGGPPLASDDETILVVEPHALTAGCLQRTLVGLGYSVMVVADGAAAMQTAREVPIGLVFISERLPDMDSHDCFRRLRRLSSVARGVLLSTTTDVQTVFAAIAAGFSRVLPKPLDVVDLMPLLQKGAT